jgi:hypothetical protein
MRVRRVSPAPVRRSNARREASENAQR